MSFYLVTLILIHTGGVIHCNEDLILPLAGLGPTQPDPIVLEVTGNVGDNPPHVQSLACAEISPGRKEYNSYCNV